MGGGESASEVWTFKTTSSFVPRRIIEGSETTTCVTQSLYRCEESKKLVDQDLGHRMALKQKFMEDFDSVSEAEKAQSVNVHGVIATMKKGKKAEYFEAKMTDGNTQVRVVVFQSGQHAQEVSLHEKLESIEIQNCEVKRAGDRAEVIFVS